LRSKPIIALLLSATFSASMVRAQQVDAYLGAGTARASSNGQSINTFGDGTLYNTPALGGVFTDFGLSLLGRGLEKAMECGLHNSFEISESYGGRDRTRTCDLLRVKQAL
jgi:hypothetical protein